MEAVKLFNQELSALYEIKPPISKAKMTSITKGAIRSIKYYKHVVQSVEKFIQKCRAEYKIPGLYVIDSIVRQSRHQFGPEKDVFAPRFAKNIQLTFYHLYKCSEEEKSRVIRVLNLWQKNEVFVSEVIQPLFDLANPNSELSKQMEEQVSKAGMSIQKSSGSSTKQGPGTIQLANMAGLSHTNQFLSQDTQNIMDQPLIAQQIQQLLNSQGQQDSTKFSSNLLDDFDYSDEESSPRVQGNIGNDRTEIPPQLLDALTMIMSTERGVQQLKQSGHVSDSQIQQLQILLTTRQTQAAPSFMGHQVSPQMNSYGTTAPTLSTGLDHSDPHMSFTQGHPGHHTIDMSQPPPIGGPHINSWGQVPNSQLQGQLALNAPIIDISMEAGREDNMSDIEVIDDRDGEWNDRSGRVEKNGRRNKDKETRRGRKTGSRSRSRSRERVGKRSRRDRRSRSKSRSPHVDRHRRGARGRSTSRERRERREDEKRDEDKRREREKKGLPPMKKGHLSVCSTTLWVGHLSKLIAEDDLSDMFGEFGEILSINTIPPRGCAFICMNRRMDAYKALKQLHKTKLHGKQMTLAWAPGKGMKDKQWKDHWDVDLGVSYIPIDKLDPQTDMPLLESGGMFDEDTMPEWMRTMRGVASSTSSNAINVPLLLQPDLVQQSSPQHPVIVQATNTSINVTTAPPPGFVNIPPTAAHGLPGGQQIPGLPTAPPGIPPFALPPGLPPGAGLLPPPGAHPGLLQGGPGLLPAPGSAALPGIPPGASHANLLIGHPRFPGLSGPLSGPPPGFPGFDVSQPPPGMTRPPLTAAQVALTLQANQSHLPSTDRDRHSSGHSVHMEIEDAVGIAHTSSVKDSRIERQEREKRERPPRESRWGGRDDGRNDRSERDIRGGRDGRREDPSDRHVDGVREFRDERRENNGRDRDDHSRGRGSRAFGNRGGEAIEERDNDPLISRLRNLAGHSSGLIQDHTHSLDVTRSLTSNLELQNQNEWNSSAVSLLRESDDPSFCEETGVRVPPSFVNQQGIHDGNGQHNFSGPPPTLMPLFENGPPHLRGGPPGIMFEGGPLGPAQFPNNNGGGHAGIAHPAFGEFPGGRGTNRGGWRGRGGPPFGGRGGGRGGYRDGPPGNWIDDVGPPGRGGRGVRGRGGFHDGSSEYNGNRNRDNWDGPNRQGQRGGQRGRGGRGLLKNFGPTNTDEQLIAHNERSSERKDEAGTELIIASSSECNKDESENIIENDTAKKDVESKRERKSRWGDNQESNDSGQTPQVIRSPITLTPEVLRNDITEDQEKSHSVDSVSGAANELVDIKEHDSSQTNGHLKHSTDVTEINSDLLPTYSQNLEQQTNEESNKQELAYSDAQAGCISPLRQKPIETFQQIVSTDNCITNPELNGGSFDTVPLDPEAVSVPTATNAEHLENNVTTQPIIVTAAEETYTEELSDNEVSCKTPKENRCIEEEEVSEQNQ